ncbi:hypothetical protein CCMA1212_006968 [Trichoderma ghanense]|uniref:Thioester reductase (TE) domain-containing protein n=1 Tax=Trichoderma ghanense TaxID=65468 RepID=A0ABY2GZ14_9HYPO
MEDRIQNFINYPLVVQGLLFEDKAEIVLMYDTSCMTKSWAVAVAEHMNHVIQQLKTDPREDPERLAAQLGELNEYVQTKFVCESVIQDVVKRLPPEQNRLSIAKPGRIIGSEGNGVVNVNDLIWRVVSGAAAIHAYPVEPPENWMVRC